MTVPDYQTLMAPALLALADGAEQPISQLRGVIAKQIELTDDDLQATLPSGSLLFANRLHWTITYLHQAGLVGRPRRAIVKITSRGRDVLAAHPDRVHVGVLLQFEEFIDFRSRTRGDATTADADPHELAASIETTPGETISNAVAEANSAVAAELLDRYENGSQRFSNDSC